MKLFLLTFLICFSLYAQDDTVTDIDQAVETVETETSIEDQEKSEFEKIKLDRLKRIRIEMVAINTEINQIKKELKSGNLEMFTRVQAESKLLGLEKAYRKKGFLFIETATNIHLNEEIKKAEKPNFFQDLQDVLAPALNSFKQLSDRPRKIQTLKERSEHLEEKYNDAVTAREKLEEILEKENHAQLKWKIKESIRNTNMLIQNLKIKREDTKFAIIKVEKDQEPFITTFSKIILDFFKTKGLNLFLALISFVLVFWLFRVGQARFISVILFRVNRSDKREIYQWVIRPIKVIYSVFSFLLAFLLSILTLYALNDWVLVTLILFVCAALVWSSKQYFPQFFEQSKIVLNLGSIRENERLMFEGIPWEIKSLGYYCRLYNPVLSGGFLRVNTRDLRSACSRRVIESEPWFPTKTGDWIQTDSVFGQVKLQSPEQVVIRTLGEEKIVYKANEFYGMPLRNLSNGFAVEFNFGVDYSHQRILFTEVIPNFIESIKAGLADKASDLKDNIGDVTIEFVQAGASSLDLRFFMKCKGNIASKKLLITRLIQAEFVATCNQHNYIIPFNQLTVHMEK